MNPEGKKKILDNLIEQELLYQEAVKEGVNRKDDVKAKIDLYRRVIVAQALVDDQIEKSTKKYYDEHAEEFKKLKLSDIMIKYASPDDAKKAKDKKGKEAMRSEADALKLANEIKARLDKGEDFATVAKETSEEPTTKNRGGDLGLISKNDSRMTSRGWGPLVDKAFEMKVGEIAGPIKTNQGYHIITVTQGLEVEPFEQAKAGLTFKVRNDARTELLAKLKKDARITYAEGEKPAEAPATGIEMPAAEGQPAPAPQIATQPAPAGQPQKFEMNIPAQPAAKKAEAKPAPKPAAKKAPAQQQE
jgi:peptidyl-prolyl cis-trans isomerase C